MERLAQSQSDIEITRFIAESKSAKTPGRPLFEDMMRAIERGEADGIIAWHPDRLARNSIDGGRIIALLDQGKLRHLRFVTYTFENNPQGKFMLSIMFGYSKYYVDALSENVKRGNRTKVENGGWPSKAPLGYLNDKANKTLVPDPERFELVKEMWRLLLQEQLSPSRIADIVRTQWRLTTPRKDKQGGALIATSAVYALFSKPIYAGVIEWGGKSYDGSHAAMISMADFERAQVLLGRNNAVERKRHVFAYSGLIRCGSCGCTVTAEAKINRYGSHYLYYHCTRGRLPRCQERSVQVQDLEQQIECFMGALTAPDALVKEIDRPHAVSAAERSEVAKSKAKWLSNALSDIAKQQDTLTDLRLREVIDDDLYVRKRQTLERRRRAVTSASQEQEADNRFEPLTDVVSIMKCAVFLFREASDAGKRLLLETVGSNLCLIGKKLSIEAAIPFQLVANTHSFPNRLAVRDLNRTLAQMSQSDETMRATFAKIRTLAEQARELEARRVVG